MFRIHKRRNELFTYTHVALACSTAFCFSKRPQIILLAGFGAAIPDLVLAVHLAIRLSNGGSISGQQLRDLGGLAAQASCILHSLPLWSIAGILTALAFSTRHSARLAVAYGGLSHCLVDALTHGRDPSTLIGSVIYPLPFCVEKYIGIWDYRPRPFSLIPLWPEWVVLAACLALSFQRAILYDRSNSENSLIISLTE
jgi:membrane-bound metal-dependent hydrolase YbcI (DUF457 family)